MHPATAKCNVLGPMNNAYEHAHRHIWGNIDPSYLLSKHRDLSLLSVFSKLFLVENIQGKFQKNSSAPFISKESLLVNSSEIKVAKDFRSNFVQ